MASMSVASSSSHAMGLVGDEPPFDGLVSAALRHVTKCPSEWCAASGGDKRPTLLQSRRAINTSPETLVSTRVLNGLSCNIHGDCLVGTVEGTLASGASPLYWAASGQFLFLLGSADLLLPPLGNVTCAAFAVDPDAPAWIYGVVVCDAVNVSILRVSLAARSVEVVVSFSAQRLKSVFITNVPSALAGLGMIGVCEAAHVVASTHISLCEDAVGTSSVRFSYFDFPLTLKQRMSFLSRPRVALGAFDLGRRLLTTLDTGSELRVWELTSDGRLVPVAGGLYPDPHPAIALCPADEDESFLFVVINKYGSRDIFVTENWMTAATVEVAGALNSLSFRRQVLAPEGCDVSLLAATYAKGVTVYVFPDRYVTATVAPLFVAPSTGHHEVVDTVDLGAGAVACLISGQAAASVATVGGVIHCISRRADFEVFADMLLDEPGLAMDSALKGVGIHGACCYAWMLLPTAQAVSASQEFIRPVIEGNAVRFTPFISVIVSQLSEIIDSFGRLEGASSQQIASISTAFELLLAKIDLLLGREGWCDTTYADSEVLSLDVSEWPCVLVENVETLSFALASSLQGVVLSRLVRSVRSAQLLFAIWCRARERGLFVVPRSVSWGHNNAAGSDCIRRLCLNVLALDANVAVDCLQSLSSGIAAGILIGPSDDDGSSAETGSLEDILVILRVLAAATSGSLDDALDLIASYAGVVVAICPTSLDALVALLTPFFAVKGVSCAPELRVITTVMGLGDGAMPGVTLAELRSRLHSLVNNMSETLMSTLLPQVIEWLPSGELAPFLRFLESLSVDDERLLTVAREYHGAFQKRSNALRNYASVGTPSAHLFATFPLAEPERSNRLVAIVIHQETLDLAGRLCVLGFADQANGDVQTQQSILSLQQRLSSMHPSAEVRAHLLSHYVGPAALYGFCGEVASDEGLIMQVGLLRFIADADAAVVMATLTSATEGDGIDANEFVRRIVLAGYNVVLAHLDGIASLIAARDDASEVVEGLCDTAPLSAIVPADGFLLEPSRLFYAFDSLIQELEGSVANGVVTALVRCALVAKSLVEDSDERNQCAAILEDRAARLLQAAEFGTIVIPHEDRAALLEAAMVAKSGMVPAVAMYTEATVAF